MGTGIKLPSQAVFILYKLFLGRALWLSSTGTKNVSLRIPSLCVQALEMALRKDYETTSPRIYVNRRTPSCSIFEFSRFERTRQKRNASISIKSTAELP